jgi:uncharacterized protein YbjT (DUF2867 family)
VIGVPLVRELVAAGHEVAGMTRSASKVEMLRGLGAEPVVCDVYDADAAREAVAAFRPTGRLTAGRGGARRPPSA